MEELGHDGIDVVKLDIEGAEYDVIENMLEAGVRPSQLLVEFHHRRPDIGTDKTRQALADLKIAGYQVFAVSPTHQEVSLIFHSSA